MHATHPPRPLVRVTRFPGVHATSPATPDEEAPGMNGDGGSGSDGKAEEAPEVPAQRPIIAWNDVEETDTDHYHVLGVNHDAGAAAIGSAFKRRSRRGRGDQ